MKSILVATRQSIDGMAHVRNMRAALGEDFRWSFIRLPSTTWDGPVSDEERRIFSSELMREKPDIVLADYSWLADLFDDVPAHVKKVIFINDLRIKAAPCLAAIGITDQHQWDFEKESALLKKADVVIALNEDDAMYCRLMESRKVIVCGFAMKPVWRSMNTEQPYRCFYAVSSVFESQYALAWIINEVWPRVKRKAPKADLDILCGMRVNVELAYQAASIALVPTVMNGGLKIRTAEALAHGLPVVATLYAVQGFEDSDAILASDDPKVFANNIIHLLKRGSIRNTMSIKAHETCQKRMTREAAYGELIRELSA